jgi:Protein of unknown function (DUF2281).
MTSLIQEIAFKSAALPEDKQQEILDFVSFIYAKFSKLEVNETTLLSEKALATDWDREEEDAAWAKFQ